MKFKTCDDLNCKNKIKCIYKDMWLCKCKKYYCNEHKFTHNCCSIKNINIMETVISCKLNKI